MTGLKRKLNTDHPARRGHGAPGLFGREPAVAQPETLAGQATAAKVPAGVPAAADVPVSAREMTRQRQLTRRPWQPGRAS